MIRPLSLQRIQWRPLGTRLTLRVCAVPEFHARSRTNSLLMPREQSVRRASSSPPAPNPKAPKFEFPPRMIVYHIGTPRIMFLGALKLTTIFVFGFFAVVVVPGCVSAHMPLWQTAGLAVASTIPFLAVWYLTSPMVVWVHMRIPEKYRRSKHVVAMYLNAPPPDAEVTITNMGVIFKPRMSQVKIVDLKPARKRFGLVNYTRDSTDEDAQRKWWMFRAVKDFRIEDETTTGSRTKWAWEDIARQIKKRTPLAEKRNGRS